MHIVVIAPEDLPVPAVRGGSVQIYLERLHAEWSRQKSHRVTFITPGERNQKLTSSNRRVRHLPIHKRGIPYWSRVMSALSRLKPDVIQIENRPARALQVKRAHPNRYVVLNLHSTTFLGPRHIPSGQVRTALGAMDAIVCNSQSLKRTIQSRFGVRRMNHFHVIYPGVSTHHTKSTDVTVGRPHKPLRLLYVGRVIEQKGVHIAIEAARILRRSMPVELTIVGRTPPWEANYRKRLKRVSRQTKVRFKGFVRPEHIVRMYQQHDVFICPSQKHEALGLVNLEAMQCGLPVVASHIGGIPEAIGTRGGITIHSYRKAEAFANAIKHLCNKRTYQRYSQYAKARARKFTWRQTRKRFAHLYRSLSSK